MNYTKILTWFLLILFALTVATCVFTSCTPRVTLSLSKGDTHTQADTIILHRYPLPNGDTLKINHIHPRYIPSTDHIK